MPRNLAAQTNNKLDAISTKQVEQNSNDNPNNKNDRYALNSEIESKSDNESIETKAKIRADTEQEVAEATVTTERIALKLPRVVKPKSDRITDDDASKRRPKKVEPKEYLSKIAFKEYGIANDTVMDITKVFNQNGIPQKKLMPLW